MKHKPKKRHGLVVICAFSIPRQQKLSTCGSSLPAAHTAFSAALVDGLHSFGVLSWMAAIAGTHSLFRMTRPHPHPLKNCTMARTRFSFRSAFRAMNGQIVYVFISLMTSTVIPGWVPCDGKKQTFTIVRKPCGPLSLAVFLKCFVSQLLFLSHVQRTNFCTAPVSHHTSHAFSWCPHLFLHCA